VNWEIRKRRKGAREGDLSLEGAVRIEFLNSIFVPHQDRVGGAYRDEVANAGNREKTRFGSTAPGTAFIASFDVFLSTDLSAGRFVDVSAEGKEEAAIFTILRNPFVSAVVDIHRAFRIHRYSAGYAQLTSSTTFQSYPAAWRIHSANL
jgi:hypothetical protein